MRSKIPLLIFSILIITAGCSGGNGDIPTIADDTPAVAATHTASHQMWGLWQFIADPVNETLDIIQLRSGSLHLNALPFLEPPPHTFLTLESLQFNGDTLEADIGLRHPFLGLTEFSGFDVCGILITNGSVSGYDNPDLILAGDGDTRLLNPDGYSRWWNPAEFPDDGTIKGYTDGLLGVPYEFADYNSTLNAYKYFCDDLDDPTAPMSEITIDGRGLFSSGQKNIRHYSIQIGTDGLVFNYAIDACWQFPQGTPPWTAPDDFAAAANRPEAYRIEVNETENTLWAEGAESGGDLSLLIDVYDWFNADLNTVQIESTGNFDTALSTTPIDGGPGYSTYQVDITEAYPATAGEIDLFITVQSDSTGYDGLLPGEPVCAYFFSTTTVDDEKPEEPPPTPEWNQLQNDPAHIGFLEGDADIDPPLQLVWSADLDTSGSSSTQEGTPIVGEGKVMVIYPYNSHNWAECRSVEDGSFLWKVDLNPNVYNSYLGTATGCYADGKFFVPGDAIRAIDADTGDVLWTYTPNEYETQRHGLVYDDDHILVHLSSQIHIINAGTGVPIDVVNVSSGYANFQSFTLVDDIAFTQLSGYVRSYDLDTGALLWSFNVDPPIYGSDTTVRCAPTVPGDDKVYFGCYNMYYYAVNQQTGALEWKIQMNNGSQRSFDTSAYYDGKIYYGEGGFDNANPTIPRFVCLDADTGDELWSFQHPSATANYTYTWYYCSPAIANGVVYAACYLGYFCALDAETGDLLWYYEPAGRSQCDPSIADGKVFFISGDSKLWCFESQS